MKSYTCISQSKKLAEILPIESADLWWDTNEFEPRLHKHYHQYLGITINPIPCWSLAALLDQFEDTAGLAKDYGLWFCYDNRKSYCTKHYDNPVDAAVEMINKLKEKDLL